MNRTSSFSLTLVFAAANVLLPSSALAGGGGASKSSVNARVKNVGTVSANVPLVAIETVEVGDAGNTGLTLSTGTFGSVTDAFHIGKYEVTVTEYAAFLNAVATRADGANSAIIESLYDSRMASDKNVGGIARAGSGTAALPYSYTVTSDPKAPVAYVSFYCAVRFANWLHNGAKATSDIETGAYDLTSGSPSFVHRSPGAKWWIPSESEWFKAAYYKGGGVSAGYWMFPTKSDTLPQNSPSTGTNVANFRRLNLYSVTQLATLDPNQNYLTAVGTYVNSPSAYGTFDQGGNVEEWTDELEYNMYGAARRTRGGAWNSGGLNDDVNPIPTGLPDDRSSKLGFRVARAADLGSGSPTSSSRTFLVTVANSGSQALAARGVSPTQVTQFRLRKGAFTVTAVDAEISALTASATFNTGNKRTTYIKVELVNNQIQISETTDRF